MQKHHKLTEYTFRRVRLFVSSTFRDMEAERNHLNQFIFPRVKAYCSERKIEFTPIDLRWGIPEEDSRNSLVLNACLDEVDQSRPYFIALLGQRYGWMPSRAEVEHLRPSMDHERAWLYEKISQKSSITEIEIDYAVLRDGLTPHAAFYLRSEEVEIPAEYSEPVGSLSATKLQTLKSRICAQKQYHVAEYHSVEELGESIYRQVIAMIEQEYPPIPDEEVEIRRNRHAYNLAMRSEGMLIGGGLDRLLEEWLKRSERIYCIYGPSGVGTSTELAAVVRYFQGQNRRFQTLYFDIEVVDLAVNPLSELFEFLDHEYLDYSSDKKIIIAVDNAHFLSLDESRQLLSWLDQQPPQVRMAVSGNTNSFFFSQLAFRGDSYNFWMEHGLSESQRQTYIIQYAARFGKRFTEAQLKQLLTFQCTPQVLTIILNALINFGRMEELDQRIKELTTKYDSHLLFSSLIDEGLKLFHQIGLTQAYGRAVIGISLAKNGIPEQDLLSAMKIEPAQWSVIKPYVLQFCKGNSSRFFFSQIDWNQAIKNIFNTPTRAQLGVQLTDWYFAEESRWRRALPTIVDIYFDIWHLPEDSYDAVRYKQQIGSLLRNPDTIKALDNNTISNLWEFVWFREQPMSDEPPFRYGRRFEELPLEEAEAYCVRMAEIGLGLNMAEDAAWFYRLIAARYRQIDPIQSTLFEVRGLMAVGRVEEAFNLLKQQQLFNLEERPQMELSNQTKVTELIARGCYLRGDWEAMFEQMAYMELLEEQCSELFTDADKVALYATLSLYCSYVVIFGSDEELKSLGEIPIEEIKHSSNHPALQLGGWIIAALMQAEALRLYRMQDTAQRARLFDFAGVVSQHAFGFYSYQHARAQLLYRCAGWQSGSKINHKVGDYVRALDYDHHGRMIRPMDYSRVDRAVREVLWQECVIFTRMARASHYSSEWKQIEERQQRLYNRLQLEEK